MAQRHEIRLSGSGGQGLVLAGLILAEAAAVYDDLNATHTQSYGPEARGGASRAEVIISDAEIDYPEIVRPDILLVMTEEACRKFARQVKEGGLILADPGFVKEIPPVDARVYRIPLTAIARQQVGMAVAANIVALGVLNTLGGLVSPQALGQAVKARVPRGTEEMNEKALLAGINAARAQMRP